MKANAFLSMGLLLGALFSLPGCATTYVPDADAPSSQLVPDFPPGTRVKLINAQSSTETLLIGEAGMGRSVRGNLHDWTGQVIKAVQSTLKAKGVTVSDNADKSLKIAVTKAALTEAGSGWSFRCTVNFTVETSSGQLATLVADDTSWKYLNACDGVIPKVALVALKDEQVVKFLNDR